jgi:hypothetical protein
MTKWNPIYVPFQQRKLVRDLGCTWNHARKQWGCTTTQFRHPTFKRWRTKNFITRQVFVDFDERAAAKVKQCRWDAGAKMWVYDVPTDDDSAAALDAWIRARLEPPPRTWLRVPFELRNEVKSMGAQWHGESKRWFWGRKTALPEGLSRFVAPTQQTRVS